MIVVSDTTAISNLVQIGKLNLLQNLYGEVIIPESVYKELQILIDLNIVSKEDLRKNWIKSKQVKDNSEVSKLLDRLDIGESQAIIMGIELSADYLLIDEKEGRLVALEKNINIIGTLGVLIEARSNNLITSVQEEMDKLRHIGFWISDNLYQKIVAEEKKMF
jgi:predicted nucleic acid-binding protein